MPRQFGAGERVVSLRDPVEKVNTYFRRAVL